MWTRECTDALNKFIHVACERMKLHLADWDKPFNLIVDVKDVMESEWTSWMVM